MINLIGVLKALIEVSILETNNNKKQKNNIDIFESNNWIESKKDIKKL